MQQGTGSRNRTRGRCRGGPSLYPVDQTGASNTPFVIRMFMDTQRSTVCTWVLVALLGLSVSWRVSRFRASLISVGRSPPPGVAPIPGGLVIHSNSHRQRASVLWGHGLGLWRSSNFDRDSDIFLCFVSTFILFIKCSLKNRSIHICTLISVWALSIWTFYVFFLKGEIARCFLERNAEKMNHVFQTQKFIVWIIMISILTNIIVIIIFSII
jgi:hypothetical protein